MIVWQFKIPPFMLSGNIMPVWLKSNNLYSSAGSKATTYFISNGNFAAGETFTLSNATQTLVFTCATTPDDSGFQFKPYIPGQTIAQFLDSLYGYLIKNYYLSTHYLIQRSTQGSSQVIRLTALETGAEWSLTTAVDNTRLLFSNTPGTDKVRRPNFKINLQVWKVGTTENTMIGEDAISPDDDGLAMFDIGEYFRAIFKASFVYPNVNGTAVFLKEAMAAKYYLRYNERFGDPANDNSVIDTDYQKPFYAIVGAIDDTLFRAKYQANSNQLAWNVVRNLFHDKLFWLTNQPAVKDVRKWQQEKLYFFLQKNIANAQVRCKVTFTDDSTAEHTVATISQPRGNVYEICAGYDALGLELLYGPDIKAWEIYVRDANTLVAQTSTRYFALKEEINLFERQLIFRNKLGAFDVVIITGDQQTGYNYERSGFELEDSNPNPFVKPITDSTNPKAEYRVQANTGFLSKAQLTWLRELVETPELYEIINGRLHVAKITSDSVQFPPDRSGVYSLSFEYSRAEGDVIIGGVGNMSIGFNFLIQ